MTTKKLMTLAAVAVVLGGLAVVSTNSKKVKTPSLAGKPLLKKVDLSEIQRLEVTRPGATNLLLESTDAGWVMKSLFGYPADIAKIRENLLKLTDLKIGHVVPGKKLTNVVLVDLQNAAGKSMATLRLGEKHMREASGEMAQFGGGGGYPDGRYVATEGETVFQVKESLDAFDGDPKSWTETQIASVPSADVTTAEFKGKGESLKLERKDGNWTLQGLGPKEELDSSKMYGIDSALSYLNFNAVADPALTEEQLGMTTGAVYTVALKNGESYTAKIGNAVGADRYFKVSAQFTAVGTNQTQNAELAKKVETFNAKTGKWTYLIPSYNADNMAKKRADVVKAKEEPKKEEPKKDEPAKKD